MSINIHTILGNVGKIETRYTPDGAAVVNMSIATGEKWKEKATGQTKEKTDWHNVVAFGKPAEIIGQYVNKGDKIFIQGKVVTRKWQDQAGQDRYTTETVVDGFNGKFELLGSRNQQNNQQPTQQQNQQVQNGGEDFDDSDIPF